ncbi:Crp/Fnr family transcriptional regulator [Alteribacillus sp. YIM 98480]|uniref:Crp/Fnr family transcriptional regulator n=1 Tax=Alteribacillus sp. YIM 98480 TaxID=2606599 RepID=UPI00131BBF0E|nr:Crp/Fnr family transcriptional regulator [Alteribacillus sp. YIM 98480]
MLYTPWLDDLSFDWSIIENNGTLMEIKKDQILYHYNDPVESVFIVKKGRIRLFLVSETGEEKAIAIIGKNGVLGEGSIFLNEPYATNAITACTTTLIKCSPSFFKEVIKENTAYSQQLFEMMSMKIHLLSEQSLHLSYDSSFHRVCKTFANLGLTYGEKQKDESIKIKISFTHQELANLIGTSRVTVTNHIQLLLSNKVIFKKGKYYYINSIRDLFNEI